MQRGGRRTHENRASRKINLIRQFENAPGRHGDEFRITPVAMFADHCRRMAKLFATLMAIMAMATRRKVMNAYPVTFGERFDFDSGVFDDSRYLMTKGEWQWMDC